MDEALLDTDMLSEVLRRRDPIIERNAAQYLTRYSTFAYSVITHYEIVRGLHWTNALLKLAEYRNFAARCAIVPLSLEIFERAALLWADGRRAGQPHRDADLLIAATALVHDRTLVTGNTAHFNWVAGLKLENWREP